MTNNTLMLSVHNITRNGNTTEATISIAHAYEQKEVLKAQGYTFRDGEWHKTISANALQEGPLVAADLIKAAYLEGSAIRFHAKLDTVQYEWTNPAMRQLAAVTQPEFDIYEAFEAAMKPLH